MKKQDRELIEKLTAAISSLTHSLRQPLSISVICYPPNYRSYGGGGAAGGISGTGGAGGGGSGGATIVVGGGNAGR